MACSYFEEGTYSGYEVRLRLDRNGAGHDPYPIRTSRDVLALMRPLGEQSAEHYYSISLGEEERVQGVYLVGKGACDHVTCDPREVFAAALLTNSSGIILVHNHPSGDANPRPHDYRIAARMREAGQILRVQLLDSVIVSPGGCYYSMADEGVLRHDLARLEDLSRIRERRLRR